jgi:hypothetical protein
MRFFYQKLRHIHTDHVLTWALGVAFAIAFCAYVYFIAWSVVHVVLRQELLVEMQEAETIVSTLEADYLERSAMLSRDLADEYGLVAVAPSAYVEVDSAALLVQRAR